MQNEYLGWSLGFRGRLYAKHSAAPKYETIGQVVLVRSRPEAQGRKPESTASIAAVYCRSLIDYQKYVSAPFMSIVYYMSNSVDPYIRLERLRQSSYAQAPGTLKDEISQEDHRGWEVPLSAEQGRDLRPSLSRGFLYV